MLVVDNPVPMCWLFSDQATMYTRAVRDEVVEHGATMPALWRLEALNMVTVAERQRKITALQGDRFLHFLAALNIRLVAELPPEGRILSYCRQYQLSAYDARYLAFAVAHRGVLASQDRGLVAAARAIGQPLFG